MRYCACILFPFRSGTSDPFCILRVDNQEVARSDIRIKTENLYVHYLLKSATSRCFGLLGLVSAAQSTEACPCTMKCSFSIIWKSR